MAGENGSGWSFQEIKDTAVSVWQAAIMPAVAGAWVVYQAVTKRHDTREDAAHREKEALRASLSAAQTALLDRFQREVERERAYREAAETQREQAYRERDEAYREKDQAMDWASGWKALGDDLWHIVKGHRATINLQRAAAGLPEYGWPDETLPALPDIVAHNALRRSRRTEVA